MISHFKKALVLSGFLILAGSAAALLSTQPVLAANPKDCDDNAIIRCGLNDADPVGDFITKYNKNAEGDLDSIFSYNGIELNSIRQNSRIGTVTKEGNVYLDGKLVATNAVSAGRQPRPNGTAFTHNGKTYYYSSTRDSFTPPSIPAIIIMNGEKFDRAILTSCGNMVKATPTGKAPEYSCDTLERTKVNDQTFEFSTKATAIHGAVVAKVVYDFGDGTTAERTNPAEKIQHTYTTPGNYTAKVTVFITVNGVTFPLEDICSKPVKAKVMPQPTPIEPIFACTGLVPRHIPNTRRYEFTAKASAQHGAVLQSANFDFDDNHTIDNVAPTATNEVAIEHEFAQAGTYTVQVTLRFNIGAEVESVECQAEVVIPETPQTPPVVTPASTSKQQPAPQEQTLPSTGPAEILSGAFGLGGLAAAGYYYTNSRRNLLGTMFKIR